MAPKHIKKKGRVKQQRQKITPRQLQPLEETRLRKLGKIPSGLWKILVGTLGLATTIFSLWGAWASTIPEIRAVGSDAAAPFSMPFSVTNPSSYFSLDDVHMVCKITNAQDSNENTYRDDSWAYSVEGDQKVSPLRTGFYVCPIRGIDGKFLTLQIAVVMTYKTLWIRRSYRVHFMWDADSAPPQWFEGRAIQ